MEPSERQQVERNVRTAETIDLLDRMTAFRAGMEPEALAIIEAELARRGVDRDEIERHDLEECLDVLYSPEGWALRCSFCKRPAVLRRWGLHKLWGVMTVPFPRLYYHCRVHAPEPATETGDDD